MTQYVGVTIPRYTCGVAETPVISLTPITDGDIPLVAAMNQQLQIDERARRRMTVAKIEDRLRSWLAGCYRALLARRGGEVVGYLIYIEEPDPCVVDGRQAYIRQLYVRSEHRREGVGRAMVERFIAEHVSAGTPVEMDVLAHNDTGRAFWEAIGFAPRMTRMRREG